MNEELLSERLQRIKDSTDRIRVRTNLPTAEIEDVAEAVENMKEYKLGTKTITENGIYTANSDNLDGYQEISVNVATSSGGVSGEGGIYLAASISERDSIKANDGDVCLVYGSSISNWTENTKASTIQFPQTVILPEAFTSMLYGQLRQVDSSSGYLDGMIDASETRFRIDGYMSTGDFRVQYTSSDGITYTRTTFTGRGFDSETEQEISLINGDTLTLPQECYVELMEGSFDILGYFMQGNTIVFDGIYEYKNDNWNFLNILTNATGEVILDGYTAYTSSGKIEGTFPQSTAKDVNILAKLSGETFILPVDSNNYFSGNTMKNFRLICDSSNTERLLGLFNGCKNLLSADLSSFDTSKVTSFGAIFYNCTGLQKIDISSFNTSNATEMQSMFYNCKALSNIDVSHFNTDKVTNMNQMFYNCTSLTDLDISNFNTSNVTDMASLFGFCTNLKNLQLGQLDTSKNKKFDTMFSTCKNIETLDVSSFDTQSGTSFTFMFGDCSKLTQLDISHFNLENATDIKSMFNGCSGFTTIGENGLNLGKLNCPKVWSIAGLFKGCTGLTNIKLSDYFQFTDNVLFDLDFLFSGCSNLLEADLSDIYPRRPVNDGNEFTSEEMFLNCTKMQKIDIRGFEFPTTQGSYWNFHRFMFGSTASKGVPDNCLIIVKDENAKTWVKTSHPRLTNVKTVAEYEG